MENTLESWLDETLSKDASDAKSAAKMMDLFALAKGIPGEGAAFLFGIRQAGAVGRSNAEKNLDEFDHLPRRLPEGILDILKKPGKAVSPRQKAFAWLHYARNMETVRHLATLSLLKAPGCDDFRNLSPNAFSTVSSRPDGRTCVEAFLRGMETTRTRETLAFLGAAANPAPVFTPRQMLLYACAHCRSVERFAWILDKLRPKLGKADFVDALGYSPFFYTVLREDSITAPDPDPRCAENPVDGGPRLLARPQMREFLDLLRKAGARPDRKCRFGFSWEDVEAVAEEYEAGKLPTMTWRRLMIARNKASGKQLEKEPVPPLEEIRRLLADCPEKAFDAIWSMDYLPESLEKPFGPRERLVSDAICDRSLPKATRARLLISVSHYCTRDDGLPPVEAREAPIGFLDSRAGRKWYCEHGKSGFEVVRCSDPAFFRNVTRESHSEDVDTVKVKIDPKIRKAIDADSPAQLMMQLSVSGKNVDARLLAVILTLCKTKILEWLLENDEKTKEFLDERRMLFYVCANWNGESATAWLKKAESKQPGILKSCVDALGRNLLWYTKYNWRCFSIFDTLLAHGCDPDAETVWGLSWRDMRVSL